MSAAAALEVAWSRLVAAADEQAAALRRTSFTPIVRDSGDLSAAVFDARGWMMAQAVTGTPGHINSLATSMRHFLAAFPDAQPGDVLLTNEPWLSSGQLNDFTVVTPIHAGERPIGFVGSTCHAVDIGGRGLSADATEVFEEGLRIPPMRLHSAGSPNRDLLALIEANVRTPELVLGDLHAQVVGNGVGVARVRELVEDLELGDLDWLATEVSARSERRLREAIAALPDGVYESEVVSDGLEEPVRIHCAVGVTGDRLIVDYAGSSPQSERGINVVMNYTQAYTTYAVKCALAPDVPHNEGTFRPLEVRAPEGSILNARFHAAVAARHVVGQFLPFAVLEALAPVSPNAAMAQGAGNIWLTTVRGRQGGEPFVAVFFASGGMGARPERDGLSTTSFPSGIATTPAEVVEATSPIVIEEKSLRADSGGVGRRRGGLGQRIRISVRGDAEWTVACLGDRLRHPAPGMAGGGEGGRGGFSICGEDVPQPKLSHSVPAGGEAILDLPGGGGFGPPEERERELVERDLRDGRVTAWPRPADSRSRRADPGSRPHMSTPDADMSPSRRFDRGVPPRRRRRPSPGEFRKVVAASLVGTSLEWYDFFLYGTAASLVFGELFFPSFDPLVGTLLAFATYSVGFVARPLGGVFFGNLGDRAGRRKALIATLMLMGGATFLIGCLPTYDSIGVFAPILLVALRFVQGLGLGGEWGGAVLMVAEHGDQRKRGLHASWPQVGVPIGNLMSAGVLALLAAVLSESAFQSWGWRIAFLLSAALIFVGLWVRLAVSESPLFEAVERTKTRAKAPVIDVFKVYRKELAIAVCARLGTDVAFYTFALFILTYVTTELGLAKTTALNAVLIASAFQLFLIPAFGAASDRFGRRPVYLAGAIGAMAWMFAFFPLLDTKSSALIILAAVGGLAFHALMYGPQAAFITELFGTRVRYSGASLGYQLAGVIGGALAPIISVALLEATGSTLPIVLYVVGALAITIGAVLVSRESADDELERTAKPEEREIVEQPEALEPAVR